MSPFLLGSTQMSQSVSILILCLSRNLKYEMCPGEKTEVEKKVEEISLGTFSGKTLVPRWLPSSVVHDHHILLW